MNSATQTVVDRLLDFLRALAEEDCEHAAVAGERMPAWTQAFAELDERLHDGDPLPTDWHTSDTVLTAAAAEVRNVSGEAVPSPTPRHELITDESMRPPVARSGAFWPVGTSTGGVTIPPLVLGRPVDKLSEIGVEPREDAPDQARKEDGICRCGKYEDGPLAYCRTCSHTMEYHVNVDGSCLHGTG